MLAISWENDMPDSVSAVFDSIVGHFVAINGTDYLVNGINDRAQLDVTPVYASGMPSGRDEAIERSDVDRIVIY